MSVIESDRTESIDQPGPPEPPASPPPTPSRRPDPWRRTLGAAFLVVALAVASFGAGRLTVGESPSETTVPTTTPTTPAQTATAPTLAPSEEPVAAVAAALAPAIVQIQTDAGLGSGVIYDESGLILTAAHVVQGYDNVLIQLADGNRVEGTVAGVDTANDIAVVQISADGLVAAPLALDQPLQPGQMAIAIGSPFGLDQTVTAGVVSSISRAVTGPNGTVRELIQTDAPINPGNSGGALADRQGRVIGINDQIFSTSGGNEGVGFAIPISRAKEVADKLVAGEPIETAYLGVTGTDPSLGTAGALITGVQPDSPAADSGLAVGDLVVAVDGTPIQSFTELAAEIRSHEPGDQVALSVQRNGNTVQLSITLATR
jgi:putative serine protease PepD